MHIPIITDYENNERNLDLFSKLLKERIILLTGEVDDTLSAIIISQLLYLESVDKEKDISIYINSPGGSVTAGLAICDTMNLISCDIRTIAIGLSASIAALILSNGTKGKRYALENADILIHQPLGGIQGQATEIKIHTDYILKTRDKINKILSFNTGQSLEKIKEDTERDFFLDPIEALNYGLIDEILK